MSRVKKLWRTTSRLPRGNRVFSLVFSQFAPYFSSIRPVFMTVEPNRVSVLIRKRRRVHNHIGTIHAIALCNGLEAAMGVLAETTIPADQRWIPKGMTVNYTAKADGDVTCWATTDPGLWTSNADQPRDLPVRVWGELADGTVVIEGLINLWVSPKR